MLPSSSLCWWFNCADCFITASCIPIVCDTMTQGQGIIRFLQVSIADLAPDPWLKVIWPTIRAYKTPWAILEQSIWVHSLHPDVCPTGLAQLLRDGEHLWRGIPLRGKSSLCTSTPIIHPHLYRISGMGSWSHKVDVWKIDFFNENLRGFHSLKLFVSTLKDTGLWHQQYFNKRQASFETCF